MSDVRQTGHTKGVKCPQCGRLVNTVVKLFSHYGTKSRMEPCGHIIQTKSVKQSESDQP